MSNYKLTRSELLELKFQHRRCKQRSHADKIKAVYLLGSGWELRDVCEALMLSDDSIYRYFHLYKEGGLTGLLKAKHMGRSSQLTSKEKKLLEMHLEENTYQSVSKIIEYVEENFQVVYKDSGMRLLLRSLGFTYKKPEKRPYRVDKVAQEKFIRKYKKLKKQLNPEDGVYFMDATHPEHTPIPSHGWIKRGQTKKVRANPRPYRMNINGAINIDTYDMVVRFEKKINKETIKDFLEALRQHQPTGWIYLICDNAGYNQSPEVQELAKAMAIKLIYLPAYSPNLNLIERIWKFFKKKVLYNRYYDKFSDMVKASEQFFINMGAYQDELRTLMTEKFQEL